MNRAFYHALCAVGRVAVFVASRAGIEGLRHVDRPGGCILAANHRSVFDCMLVMACVRRPIRWFSAVEVSLGPWRWFFRLLGVIPLHRDRADPAAVRQAVRLLRSGEIVGIFPEGQLRRGPDAVTAEGEIADGVEKLALLAKVPVVPCVVAGGSRFARWTSWLPLRRTRWAFRAGEPIPPAPGLTARLTAALRELFPPAADFARVEGGAPPRPRAPSAPHIRPPEEFS